MPLPCPACRPARNWHFSRQCILRLPRRKRCVFSKPPVTAVTRTICFFWFFPCQSWNPIFSNSVSWSWKKCCNTSHVGIRSSWAMAKLSKSSSAPLGVRLPIASDENCVTICHYLSLSVTICHYLCTWPCLKVPWDRAIAKLLKYPTSKTNMQDVGK